MSTWTYMNIKGHGYSLTLIQGPSDSTFSNFFFLETAWPIETKFYAEPPWDGGMEVWSNGLGHMTKMAAMPLYGNNLKIASSLEPKGQLPWKLECSIGYLSTTKFVQMMTWDDLDLFYRKVKFVPYAFVWEKGKTMETIVVFDIKVGRCCQLNVYMNLFVYQRSRSFIDRQRSLRFNTFKLLFLRNYHKANWSQILFEASIGWRNESEYKWFMSHDQDDCHAHIW